MDISAISLSKLISIFVITISNAMVESFELKLPSGEIAKFSIWKSAFKKDTCYFAKIIEVKKISPKNNYGTIVRAGQKTIYYTDPSKLKSDLIAFYGA